MASQTDVTINLMQIRIVRLLWPNYEYSLVMYAEAVVKLDSEDFLLD